MEIGFVGLGKMGGNMALRLVGRGEHRVVGYAKDPNPQLAGVEKIDVVASVAEIVRKLTPPRVVWVMVPAGNATEAVVTELSQQLSGGDIVIDGGNSYFKDSIRRAQ